MNTIEITPKQRAKIKRALKALEDVRNEISTAPNNTVNSDEGINWYFEDGGNLILMNGPSHSGLTATSQHDNAIETFDFPKSSGGGW